MNLDIPYVLQQLAILRSVADRGRKYCFEKKDSWGIDLFQHFWDEADRLHKHIEENR